MRVSVSKWSFFRQKKRNLAGWKQIVAARAGTIQYSPSTEI
jgi:hypothetical protein